MKLELKIPTASEARELIQKGFYEKAKAQATKIEELVNKAVAEGCMSTGDSGYYLELAIQKKLAELGYLYTAGSSRNEPYWNIEWGKPLQGRITP